MESQSSVQRNEVNKRGFFPFIPFYPNHDLHTPPQQQQYNAVQEEFSHHSKNNVCIDFLGPSSSRLIRESGWRREKTEIANNRFFVLPIPSIRLYRSLSVTYRTYIHYFSPLLYTAYTQRRGKRATIKKQYT